MKQFLMITVLVISVHIAAAQGYQHAVGVRAGWSAGVEYRYYTDDSNSYRFLLSGRNRGFQAHALKEYHKYDLFSASSQLIFVYGFGVHAGTERWNEWHSLPGQSWFDARSSFIIGGDGLAGIEYIFNELPVIAGFEVKPFFDLFGKNPFRVNFFDFALTARYLF